MSSYKRIPKSLIKKSEQSITISEDYAGNAQGYYQHMEENEIQKVKEKVHLTQQIMMEELEQQRESWVEQAYQEGFQKAKQEIEAEIYAQHEHYLNEAKELYEKANTYHQGLLQDAEKMKERYLQQEKEQLVELIARCTEKLLRQQLQEAPEKIGTMFQSILEEITYENKKVFCRVHPKTIQWLKEHDAFTEDTHVELLPDPTLTHGDMILETERECLDATIQAQIETLKHVLRSAVYD